MIRILIVLCLVIGGVDAFGEEQNKESTKAKKKKESEKWYGILGGLSQFYLKDELGSYLRYEDQTRSIALLSLTQGDSSFSSSFLTFGRGKLYASGTSVNIVYLQSEEYFYGRYLASYLQNKMKLGIMGGMKLEVYFKEYVHPPIHSQLIFDMDFGLGFAIVGDYLLKPRHHLRAYTGSSIISYYVPHSSGIVSIREAAANIFNGDLVLWNRFLNFNIGVQYANRLSSSIQFYTLYRMDYQRARRYERTASMFAHNLLIGFAYKVK
ncbi:MAG: hypothetical protein OXH16_21115 [Gemmatimonadetes bacterium]|nr:hypothetical protein [Gemmatimonadota bacterium]